MGLKGKGLKGLKGIERIEGIDSGERKCITSSILEARQ
jgi:hypothetical protein